MSQLQQLLYYRYPSLDQFEGISPIAITERNLIRAIFTEGYNACKEEAKSVIQSSINSAYQGREGCTWGDTSYDSLSVAHGQETAFKEILQDLQNKL